MSPHQKSTKEPEYSKQAAKYMNRLLPEDIATPADLAAIAESQADYERGETISHSDIDWES
ncbi:MAG: hypothetical protein FWC13_07520 [Oscillospiraceae bacterium]|nr:hypothetical protein [Oscillospiraceae bacterium]